MLSRQSWPLARIAFLSVLIMFLEMLLIRWVGTELRVFAYLQNGVLVAAFLGLGLGARNARQPARLLPSMLALTVLAAVISDPLDWSLGEGVTQGLAAFQDSVVWFQATGVDWPPYVRTALVSFSLVMSLFLLAAVAYTFRPLGQWLGAWLDAYPRPIAAYTANILGSLFGIALFVAATVTLTTPVNWLAAAGVGLAICAIWAEDGRVARAAAVGLRAHFRKAEGPYDLIWFGLLDSHTNPSAYPNVRLDHFVYTRESFEDMKGLLGPSGVVVLFFAPEADWISGPWCAS